MSTLESNQSVWSLQREPVDPKYEKCRNITEEIYKRINITFQIKKLEMATQSEVSDHSDQIDSNELSNETDLFACDKTDSISSSTEPDGVEKRAERAAEKYININNNEETNVKKPTTVYKRPRKRFRKRVKKRQSRPHSDSDGSSDEALPLSRVVEADATTDEKSESDNVMGVPKISIITKDLKPKIKRETPEKDPDNLKVTKKTEHAKNVKDTMKNSIDTKIEKQKVEDVAAVLDLPVEKGAGERKNCTMCSSSFRGERGLKRHMAISHMISREETKKN